MSLEREQRILRAESRVSPDNPFAYILSSEHIFTARTLKGITAQFVNAVSWTAPEMAMKKKVLPIEDIKGIEKAVFDGLEKGFSIGIATCPIGLFVKGGMESAPYWCGKSGIRSERDFRVFLEGDQDWEYFGAAFPTVEEREKRPWLGKGFLQTTKHTSNLVEVVVNYHPFEYGLDPENHYVARVSMLEDQRVSGEMRLGTYILRALGGGLEPRHRIFFNFPSTLELTHAQKYDNQLPPGYTAYGRSYLTAKFPVIIGGIVNYVRGGERLYTLHSQGKLTTQQLEEKMKELHIFAFPSEELECGLIFTDEAGRVLLEIIDLAEEGGLATFFRKIKGGAPVSRLTREAVYLLERVRREERELISKSRLEAFYRLLVKPEARRTVERFLSSTLLKKGKEILQLGEVLRNLEDFEPILEFIGTHRRPQLYEVREIPRSARRRLRA